MAGSDQSNNVGDLGLYVNPAILGNISVSNIIGSNSGVGFGPFNSNTFGWETGNFSADGFGKFNVKISGLDAWTYAVDTLTFTLSIGSGSWASASNVLAPNSDNSVAASHVIPALSNPPSNPDQSHNFYGLNTGFADQSVVRVPEPGILILLGIAMSAIGMASWRIRKI